MSSHLSCSEWRWAPLLMFAAMAAMAGPAVAQSHQESFRHQEQLAAAGDVAAMRRVGIGYAMGRGVAKNEHRGFQWVSRAANAGDGEAMYNLSKFYLRGVGVPRDQTAAKEWLAKSERAGFSPKSLDTPKQPAAGPPVLSKSVQKAFENFERRAAAGDAGAMAELGYCYQHGLGTARDFGKAAEMFQKGADAGNRRCIHDLGACYATGRGVTQDWAKAFALFKRGADAQDPVSMHDLALCYYQGKGVPVNQAEAQKWLNKSAKAGYTPSKQALASIARASRTPAAGKAMSPEQARAALALLWAFSQMMGSGSGPSDAEKARDEEFKEYIRHERDAQREETDARIRARERGEF
jgi:uncharacterized protein